MEKHEPKTKYKYEVEAKDTKIGKTYYYRGVLLTRIGHRCSNNKWKWFIDTNYTTRGYFGNVILLSSTNTATRPMVL